MNVTKVKEDAPPEQLWSRPPSLLAGMKECLSLAAFKRKQLRQERYPSQAHPPLGAGFLPLSRTAAFLFGVEAHLFGAPLGPPRLPPQQLLPLLSPSPLHLHSFSLPTDLNALWRAEARRKIRHKESWVIWHSDFYPDFSHKQVLTNHCTRRFNCLNSLCSLGLSLHQETFFFFF